MNLRLNVVLHSIHKAMEERALHITTTSRYVCTRIITLQARKWWTSRKEIKAANEIIIVVFEPSEWINVNETKAKLERKLFSLHHALKKQVVAARDFVHKTRNTIIHDVKVFLWIKLFCCVEMFILIMTRFSSVKLIYVWWCSAYNLSLRNLFSFSSEKKRRWWRIHTTVRVRTWIPRERWNQQYIIKTRISSDSTFFPSFSRAHVFMRATKTLLVFLLRRFRTCFN